MPSKKPHIMTIAGNRPQFIKLAPVSRELRRVARETLVHSGQHYDFNMSDIFFEELGIAPPAYNLGVSEKLHGAQTARILVEIEKLMIELSPDAVVVFGDTNTTLAAALSAVKLHIPIAHIEAGPRMRDRCESPEEANRIMVDHVSSQLFAPTRSSLENLKNEGVFGDAYFSGDTMYDTFLASRASFTAPQNLKKFEGLKNFEKGGFVLVTLHRPLNVDDGARLETIVRGLLDSGERIIFPVHPRTKAMMEKCRAARELKGSDRVSLIEPQGYIGLGALQSYCKKIVTDSGGVSKEAYFNKKQCVTVYPMTPWPETEEAGTNIVLRRVTAKSLAAAVSSPVAGLDFSRKFFGNGRSAEFIAKKVAAMASKKK